jgi:hypothetical protein
MARTKVACKEALARGAPLHAGANADPTGILDQQDIIDVIGEQLVKGSQGDPDAICKGLKIWSALQRLPCSMDVFELACEYLGFWGPDAKQKAMHWMHKQRGSDSTWITVFDRLCLCVRHDRMADGKSYGLVKRWGNVLQEMSPECANAERVATLTCSGAEKVVYHPCSKMIMEMYDHAAYGYMPEWGSDFHTPKTRCLFKHLAKSLLGRCRDRLFGENLAAMSQARMVLLSTGTVTPLAAARLETVLKSGAFTSNTRVDRGLRFFQLLEEKITLDVAAYLLPSERGRDTVIADGQAVPNATIDVVLSQPDYDPRKCINMPAAFSGAAGGVTLLGLFLAGYHYRGRDHDVYWNPVVEIHKSNKWATLARILDHPLQDLRQGADSGGLVHACLSKTITVNDKPIAVSQSLIAEGVRAWTWRRQALALLWDKTCNEDRDARCIWGWKNKEGKTPREVFEHQWGSFSGEMRRLLSHCVGRALQHVLIKMIADCYNDLNDVFVVAGKHG